MKLKNRKIRFRLGMFGKITISVFVITALVICSAAMLSIGSFSRLLLDKEWVITRQAAEKLSEFAAEKYALLNNQTNLMNTSNHVTEIFTRCSENPYLFHNYANIKFIMDYLHAVCRSDENILDIILVPLDNTYSYSKSNRSGGIVLTSFDFLSTELLQKAENSNRRITAFYDPAPGYIVGENEPVISLVSKLYYDNLTKPNGRLAAYVIVNYSVRVFDDILLQMGISQEVEFLISNSLGEVVYSNNPAYLQKIESELVFPETARMATEKLTTSGMQIVAVLSESAIMPTVQQVIGRMIPIFAISTVLILVVILGFYRIYKRRISAVTDKMLTIASNNLHDRLPVTSDDELGRLNHSFNQMCETLDSYIKLNYKAELSRRTAELNALQAQINPHFLFNTIESIRMRAMLSDNQDVAEMLTKLGNMFRWMIQYKSHFVYVEDELEYISSYLYLQKIRFGERIEVNMDVPDDLMYLGIPKFTLQPVVENAIQHGMRHAERLNIAISAGLQDGMVTFEIRDNGPGIPEEKLEKLNLHIQDKMEEESFGIGLRNVNLRLRMLFGDDCGLRVESQCPGATAVFIALPALQKKEMENHVSNDRG